MNADEVDLKAIPTDELKRMHARITGELASREVYPVFGVTGFIEPEKRK